MTGTAGRRLSYLGVDLSGYSHGTQVRIVTAGFMVFWMIYGIIQERVMKVERFPYAWTLTLFQVLIYTSLGVVESTRGSSGGDGEASWPRETKQRLHMLLLLGLSGVELVLHRGLGNVSFHYLSFSVKVMFQSAKILPVIVVGVLFFRKSYAATDYLAALLISLGIGIFSGPFAGSSDSAADDDGFWTGMALMSVVLLSEAAKPNLWKATFDAAKRYQVRLSHSKLVALLNGCGVLLLVPTLFIAGEGLDGVVYLWQHPRFWLSVCAMFFLGYAAQISSVTHVDLTDPLSNSILSTSRKLLSIALSFVWYGRTPTVWNAVGFAVFAVGLLVSTYGDARKQKPAKAMH